MNRPNAVLDTENTMTAATMAAPIKVKCIENFLPKEERDRFFEALCQHDDAFVGNSMHGKAQSSTSFLSIPDERLSGKAEELVEVATALSQRILDYAPQLFKKLEIPPRTPTKLPLTFIHGLNDHYGDVHADATDGRYRISLVYYLHKKPKAFKGGNLAFYEANTLSTSGHSDKALLEVETTDNMLVAFPSQSYHGVSRVRSTSSAFADGRFAAVAFI